MKTSRTMITFSGSQRGFALLMGLLVLVVALLLGVAATNSTIMQEKMAGNFRDSSLAFQAAEAGSRWGMTWLQSRKSSTRPYPCSGSCTSEYRVWSIGQYPSEPSHKDSLWADARSRSYGLDPTYDTMVDPAQSFPMVITQPRYIMEQQHFARDDLAGPSYMGVAYYRVTALGNGARSTSAAIIRTLVAKRYR